MIRRSATMAKLQTELHSLITFRDEIKYDLKVLTPDLALKLHQVEYEIIEVTEAYEKAVHES